jgi:hypothetical protein
MSNGGRSSLGIDRDSIFEVVCDQVEGPGRTVHHFDRSPATLIW